MKWAVEMADEFKPEFDALHEDVRAEVLALSLVNPGVWAAIRPASR